MYSSESFGNQDFDGLPHQFFAAVPEDLANLRVYIRNFALRIDDDNGVRREFEQLFEQYSRGWSLRFLLRVSHRVV